MSRATLSAAVPLLTLMATASGQGSWTQAFPANAPSARSDPALVYDRARQEVLLFGGGPPSGASGYADTWTWDATAWTRRFPTRSPSPRNEHALAYDAARQQIVMFGGFTGTSNLPDTWTWNGSTWSPATGPGPSARRSHGLAYDSSRQRVVLFGGYDGTLLDDTWEWDGVAWTPRSSATRPSARSGINNAMTYDPVRGTIVLFGGEDSRGMCDDLWEWDGNTWFRTPTSGSRPARRSQHSVTFDIAHGTLVVYGGWSGTSYISDTWEWDRVTWRQTHISSPPGARADSGMVYDEARGKSVLFGGQEPGPRGDTWTYVARGTPTTIELLDGQRYLDPRNFVVARDLDSPGVTRDGVAADGAAQLLVRVTTSVSGSVDFSIASTSNDTNWVGAIASPGARRPTVLTSYTTSTSPLPNSSLHTAHAVYHAPLDFADEASRLRDVTVVVTAPGAASPIRVTIKIARPPVVLCHGLWSSEATWRNEFRFWVDQGFPYPAGREYYPEIHVVNLRDYGSKAHFWENNSAVASAIDEARKLLTDRGIVDGGVVRHFACGQVNWVGHSMGGILPRNFYRFSESAATWKVPANYGRGPIHKLVIMNSPQRGSRLGNVLSRLDADLSVSASLRGIGAPIGGAIIDVAESSSALVE